MHNWLAHLSIKWRLIAIFCLVFLVIAIVGGVGIGGMKGSNRGLESVVNGHVQSISHLKNVADAYAVSIIDATNKANAGVFTAEEAAQSIQAARQVITDAWPLYLAGISSANDKALAGQAQPLFDLANAESDRVLGVLRGKTGNIAGLLGANIGPLYAAVDPISNHLSSLLTNQLSLARAEFDIAESAYATASAWAWGVGTIGIGLALGFAWMLLRAIVHPLQILSREIDAIAAGNTHIEVVVGRDDEIGAVAASFKRLRDKLRQDMEIIADESRRATRIKVALDNIDANVMMADNNRNIIYVNKALEALFRHVQADIRKDLPHFDVDKLLGSNIDIFHKNPAHQAGMLAKLVGTYKSALTVGGRTMVVIASPVIDEKGERLGSVVQWADRTVEVAVEQAVSDLVSAAAAGDFSRRLSM
ncbi:MAG: hypothetical protein B7Y41_16435, partial [Hydrogenophilales bacterium 28-61-23]